MENLWNLPGEMWKLAAEMAPWLLFGFLMAGVMHQLIPRSLVTRHLQKRGMASTLKASLLGVPLPLCSCSVIPVAAHLRRQGAGKGASVSFLASTPSTGVDSIFATWALLGPVFAVIRPLYSLISGWLAGLLTDRFAPDMEEQNVVVEPKSGRANEGIIGGAFSKESGFNARKLFIWIREALYYGFVDLTRDIRKWLLIGIAIGGLITWALPEELFSEWITNPVWAYLIMLGIGLPMYVCATSSIPIAAALVMKGMSPGAALIFLAIGPATNTATLGFLLSELGKKVTAIYVAVLAAVSLGFGILLDLVLFEHSRELFRITSGHEHITVWGHLSAMALFGLLAWHSRPQKKASCCGNDTCSTNDASVNEKKKEQTNEDGEQKMKKLHLPDMTCGNCQGRITKVLESRGIETYHFDLEQQYVSIPNDSDTPELRLALAEAHYPVENS